jgi:hypothetical protein
MKSKNSFYLAATLYFAKNAQITLLTALYVEKIFLQLLLSQIQTEETKYSKDYLLYLN